MELSCNDGGGLGSSREALEGISEEEGSPEYRVHSRQDGARGRMVSGSNEQRLQRRSKEDQKVHQIKELVECPHQRKKNNGRKRKKMKKLVGSSQGESTSPEVDSVIQDQIVEWVLVEP
jgi:hypothetical protein